MALLSFKFELFLGGSWVDVTSYVRDTQAVTIKRGSTDWAPKLTPATAKFKLDNSDDRFNPRNPLSPYYGLLVRNTPVRISRVGSGSNNERFYGEVYGFEPRWNKNRSDCSVSIEASGTLRRILKNQTTPKSSYRSWMNTHSSYPFVGYYYPLEEGSDAIEATPDIGAGGGIFNAGGTPPKSWGAATMNDWFPNGVSIPANRAMGFPTDMRGAIANAWEVTALLTFSSDTAVAAFEINCSYQTWWVVFRAATNDVMVIAPDKTTDTSSLPGVTLSKDAPVWVNFRVTYDAGLPGLVAYVAGIPIGQVSDSIIISNTASMLNYNVAYPRFMFVHNQSADDSTIGVSNLSVSESQSGTTGFNITFKAMKGSPGENTRDRFERLCDEQGVANSTLGDFVPMGRQYVQSFEDHLTEIMASSNYGTVVESRSGPELLLTGTPGNSLVSGIVNYSELFAEPEPVEDDQLTANIVTVVNSHGGQTTVSKTSGTMSVDEIGPVERKLETNTKWFSQAASLADLTLARGTWPGPRFSAITVSAQANPSQYSTYRKIDVGGVIWLDGMSPAGYYDQLTLLVLSVSETITQTDHLFTYTVAPGEIVYQFWVVENGGYRSRLDVDDCTTVALVNSSVTTIDVNVPTALWATSGAFPFDVMVAGERMTVTAVSNLTSTTQRMTVTRSVNGVVKSIPAGSEVHIFPAGYLKA